MTRWAVLGTTVVAALLGGCTVREGRGHGRPYGGHEFGGPVMYGPAYGMAGCGLGAVIFGPDNTPSAQLIAATTNGTFGTQTSGITSGTSNCTWGGIVRVEREQAAFAEVNFKDLKRDMAAGSGEFLASFSTLLGCEERAKPTLFAAVQARYATILPSDQTSPSELVGHVKEIIKGDAALALDCTDARALARLDAQAVAIR